VLVAEDEAGALQEDRAILFLTIFIENRESLLSIGRCHAKGRGRRVRMSSSGNKEKGEHPGSLQGHA
jgi:hypothetical protein